MADQQRKKRTFRKFTYRGRDLENLVDITVAKKYEELMGLLHARARRRLTRGLKRKAVALLRKVKAAIKAAKYVDGVLQKPDTVKTHLRNMIIVPEMIGGVVGVYNGQSFTTVEIKPPMVGHYLGEFSITYKPIKHGRPGIGATNSSRFIPLK